VVVSSDEAAKVASTDQFFNFILECFAFFCSVAMVAVIVAIFGHIGIGRCVIFFAYQNPPIFIVASFNCIFKNQIFEINSVFVVRRLRVILTLTILFTTNWQY